MDAPGAAGSSGSAGASSGGGQASEPGEPAILATAQDEVLAITADEDEVVWISSVDRGSTAALRAASTSDGPRDVIESDPDLLKTRALAMDSGAFFLAYDRALLRSPRVAPNLQQIFDPSDVSALWLGAADIYMGAPWGVTRLPKLGPGELLTLAPEGSVLLGLEEEQALIQLADATGSLHLVPGDGSIAASDAPTLLQETDSIGGIDYDADAYYFTSPSTGDVFRLGRGDSTPATLAEGESVPGKLAVTRAAVYWVTDSGGALRRRALDAGSVETIGSARPGLLARAGDAVFWVSTAGELMAVHD